MDGSTGEIPSIKNSARSLEKCIFVSSSGKI